MKNVKRIPDAINCSISKNYTSISNEIIRSKELSFKAKGVLAILLSNKEGWTSYKKAISKMSKESNGIIETAIKELESTGYLARIRYRDIKTKKWIGSFWAYSDKKNNFNITEQVKSLFKQGFEPHTKNPFVGLPNVENCTLIKLTNKKTKENKKPKIKLHSPNPSGTERQILKRTKWKTSKTKETPKLSITEKNKLRNKEFLPQAKQLKEILQEKKNIQINGQKLTAWTNSIRLLCDYDKVQIERIQTVLDWYAKHWMDDFVPVVESGSSFREKFTRLEDAIERSKTPKRNTQGSFRTGKKIDLKIVKRTYNAKTEQYGT